MIDLIIEIFKSFILVPFNEAKKEDAYIFSSLHFLMSFLGLMVFIFFLIFAIPAIFISSAIYLPFYLFKKGVL